MSFCKQSTRTSLRFWSGYGQSSVFCLLCWQLTAWIVFLQPSDGQVTYSSVPGANGSKYSALTGYSGNDDAGIALNTYARICLAPSGTNQSQAFVVTNNSGATARYQMRFLFTGSSGDPGLAMRIGGGVGMNNQPWPSSPANVLDGATAPSQSRSIFPYLAMSGSGAKLSTSSWRWELRTVDAPIRTVAVGNVTFAGSVANFQPVTGDSTPTGFTYSSGNNWSVSVTDNGQAVIATPYAFTVQVGTGPVTVKEDVDGTPVTVATFSAEGTYTGTLYTGNGLLTLEGGAIVSGPGTWTPGTGGTWTATIGPATVEIPVEVEVTSTLQETTVLKILSGATVLGEWTVPAGFTGRVRGVVSAVVGDPVGVVSTSGTLTVLYQGTGNFALPATYLTVAITSGAVSDSHSIVTQSVDADGNVQETETWQITQADGQTVTATMPAQPVPPDDPAEWSGGLEPTSGGGQVTVATGSSTVQQAITQAGQGLGAGAASVPLPVTPPDVAVPFGDAATAAESMLADLPVLTDNPFTGIGQVATWVLDMPTIQGIDHNWSITIHFDSWIFRLFRALFLALLYFGALWSIWKIAMPTS